MAQHGKQEPEQEHQEQKQQAHNFEREYSKLQGHTFRFTEKLLYEQKGHASALIMLEGELEELEASLIPSGSTSVVDMSMPKGRAEYTQPEAYAIRIEENLQVRYLRDRITEHKRHRAAIAAVLEHLSEEESQLVFLKYNEDKSHGHCARALHMWSEAERRPTNTYWRLRRRVVASGKVLPRRAL